MILSIEHPPARGLLICERMQLSRSYLPPPLGHWAGGS